MKPIHIILAIKERLYSQTIQMLLETQPGFLVESIVYDEISAALALKTVLSRPDPTVDERTVVITAATGVEEIPPAAERWLEEFSGITVVVIDRTSPRVRAHRRAILACDLAGSAAGFIKSLRGLFSEGLDSFHPLSADDLN